MQMYLSESEFIDNFTRSLRDVSSETIRVYVSSVQLFMHYLADNRISSPTQETISAYIMDLSQTKSDSTTALYLAALRRFFSWCELEGLYPDIARDIKSPHVEKYNKRDALSVPQVKQIISGIDCCTLEGLRNYAIICLMVATGLRTIEVKRANVGDIRYVHGEYVLFVQGKGRNCKDAFVKLSGHVLTAIRDYLSARESVSNDEPLFASCSKRNYGGRLTTKTVSTVCKSAMRKAGYNSSRLTAHSLRHTAITLALTAGLDLRDVSNFARHSDVQGTLIYAHDISREKRECENVISNAIFSSLKDKRADHSQYRLPFPS